MITFKATYDLDRRVGLQNWTGTKRSEEIIEWGRLHLLPVADEIQTPPKTDKNYGRLIGVIRREDERLNLCVIEPLRKIFANIPFGFDLVKLEASFDNARLPACLFTRHRHGRYVRGGHSSFRNGAELSVDCNPTARTVTVSSYRILPDDNLYLWSGRFQPACLNIVRILNASKAARRLTVAVRSRNRQQVRRVETELFEAIGYFVNP